MLSDEERRLRLRTVLRWAMADGLAARERELQQGAIPHGNLAVREQQRQDGSLVVGKIAHNGTLCQEDGPDVAR
jgi:hypothetical protein